VELEKSTANKTLYDAVKNLFMALRAYVLAACSFMLQ
jgi:hypothetical protein